MATWGVLGEVALGHFLVNHPYKCFRADFDSRDWEDTHIDVGWVIWQFVNRESRIYINHHVTLLDLIDVTSHVRHRHGEPNADQVDSRAPPPQAAAWSWFFCAISCAQYSGGDPHFDIAEIQTRSSISTRNLPEFLEIGQKRIRDVQGLSFFYLLDSQSSALNPYFGTRMVIIKRLQ